MEILLEQPLYVNLGTKTKQICERCIMLQVKSRVLYATMAIARLHMKYRLK